MRKLILSMNVTLDGFISGPHGELDWHFPLWDNEMSEYASEYLDKTDTLLLGRITYQAMAGYWPFQATNPYFPRKDIAFADMMNNHSKIVFSKTLSAASWNNTTLAHRISVAEINQLKRKAGKCMLIYGSGTLASTFIQLNLVDELMFWVHPVLIGKGIPLFKNLKDKVDMQLINTKSFKSGVYVLHYKFT